MNHRIVLSAALASVVLAACGGSAGSDNTANSRPTGTTALSASGSSTGSDTGTREAAIASLSARLITAGSLNQAEMSAAAKSASATGALRKSLAATGTQSAVHRFWNPATGAHFYTASEEERDAVLANLPAFVDEGVAFHAHSASVMGLAQVHRFFNTVSGTHFYTSSDAERAYVQANIPELRYEGVSYFVAQAPTQGFVPAFRFFNPAKANHFYTRSEAERDQLVASSTSYIYEGTAFYVLPSPDTAAPVLSEVFPAAGESVPTTQAHVSGKVSDNLAVKSVTLVMGDVTVNATVMSGEFSAKLPLQAGLNAYTIVAEDHAGNRLESPATVYLGARVAAGGSHSGAIRGGLLHTVGRNNTGQLGFGNTSTLAQGESLHPSSMRQIPHAAGVPVSLMFNQNFSLMLDAAGTVWSWGTNSSGQLGVGTCGVTPDTTNRLLPTQVTGLSSVATIAAGYDHSLVLRRDGTVWAFGENGNGQLGDGSTVDRDCPVRVQGLPNDARVIQVAAGAASSYALDDQGRVWAWGRNQYGNLGLGTTSGAAVAQSAPVRVPLGAPVVMLANGRDHVLALTASGGVIGWGLNASAQLSGDWASQVSTPAELPALPAASSRRVWANGNSSWVMKEVGVPYRWGQRLGNAGTDFPTANLPAPQRVSNTLTGVLDVGPGASHWVVLKSSGDMASLGWSFEASLGGGPSTINTWAYVEPIAVMFP